MQNTQLKKAKLSNNVYSCKCKRTFETSKQLNNHMRSHINDEEYTDPSGSSPIIQETPYDNSDVSIRDIADLSIGNIEMHLFSMKVYQH